MNDAEQRVLAEAANGSGPLCEMQVSALFAAAAEFHRGGRLAEAEARYREILAIDPGHADSLHCLGLVAYQTGHLVDATDLIRRAIARNQRDVGYLNNLGLVLQARGQIAEAIESYQRVLALQPDYAPAHFNTAIALVALGRPSEAIASYRRALAVRPNYAEALNNLGNLVRDQGQLDEAVECYRRALAARPDYAEAHNNLGNVRCDQRRPDLAEACYREALALRPDYAEAHNNLGNALRALGRPHDAEMQYRKVISIRPTHAEAHAKLAAVLHAQADSFGAVEHYRQALAIGPDEPLIRFNLGVALQDLERHAEAVEAYRQVIALAPGHKAASNNMGVALQDLEQPDAALSCYERALSLDPDYAEAHANRGTALVALGRIDEARRCFDTAVALAPANPRFHRLLGETKTMAFGEPETYTLLALSQDAEQYEGMPRVELHFAVAKACEDIGAHAESFRHLLTGNAIKRRLVAYDERALLDGLERIRRLFTPEAMRSRRGFGDPSPVPVFIVGMPRSGSTLIEQVLASHSQVHGAGELPYFADEVGRIDPRSRGDGLPSGEALGELAARYLADLRRREPDAARVVDKMPGNFHHIGLIHLALPNARIIHSRRDPIETCLSCFSRLFDKDNLPFSYDLAELGRHYRAYQQTMTHWRAVLPAGVMLEVDYEAMVDDLEGQARRIVAHCGLGWEASCLSFHTTPRTVNTASAIQVRQPLYRTSLQRWRPEAELLLPLTAALAGNDQPSIAGDRHA